MAPTEPSEAQQYAAWDRIERTLKEHFKTEDANILTWFQHAVDFTPFIHAVIAAELAKRPKGTP